MNDLLLCFELFIFQVLVLILFSKGHVRYTRKIPMPPEHLRGDSISTVLAFGKGKGNCYLDCGNTYSPYGEICLNCGSSIVKSELPKDKIK